MSDSMPMRPAILLLVGVAMLAAWLLLPWEVAAMAAMVLAGLGIGGLLGRLSLGGTELHAAVHSSPMPLALLGGPQRAVVGNAAFGALPAPIAAAMQEGPLGEAVALAGTDDRWWSVLRVPLPGGRSLSLGCDISALRRDELAQGILARTRQQALDLTPVGLWLLDAEGRTVFANAALAALFGGRVPEDIAASGLALAPNADPERPFGLTPGVAVEMTLPDLGHRVGLGHGGRLGHRQLAVTATPWPEAPGGGGCCLSVADNAPLRAALARVEHLAEHDPLTGLGNRAQFRAALAALAHSPGGGALILLNLHQFAQVNERYGMAAGDAVLRSVARRLRAEVRPSDMVCRLGDDRFAVLAFGIAAEGRNALAERLRQATRVPIWIDGMTVQMTASLGSAMAPADAAIPETLLRAADLAQRLARAEGGDGHSAFRPKLLAAQQRRERLREALAAALAEGGLQLAYQPQRDWLTGALVGAEALLRWHCPALGGAISPAELFPVAAEAGLLGQIDSFVLETALAQMAAWQGQPGAPPLVSVNITVQGLRSASFADQVARALLRHRVPAAQLEVEIPEDLSLCDLPATEATLAALHEMGVRLALDDFGSGHSSLPHIVRLPVHRLKLDRSIVSGLPGDAKASAVLQATMAIARDLGVEVVGEGVETEAQAAALAEAGCTLLQGWLTGRPGPAEALTPPPVRVAA